MNSVFFSIYVTIYENVNTRYNDKLKQIYESNSFGLTPATLRIGRILARDLSMFRGENLLFKKS